MPVGDPILGDRRAVQIVLDTLGDRRLRGGAEPKAFLVTCRIDTPNELDYYRHGGILHYVLRQMAASRTS